MVSALRLRATRQPADPIPPDAGAVAAGQPVGGLAGMAATWRRRRLPTATWLRGFNFRRFGLAVSIVGAMAASAIGGGLLAARPPLPAAAVTGTAAAPNAVVPVVAAGPAVEPAVSGQHAAPMAAAAAPAAEHAEHVSAEATSGAAEPPAAHGRAGAASAVPLAAADNPQPATATQPPPAADLTFGLDVNGDGIPDSLERFVRKAIDAPATRVAARRYYRIALPLAATAEQGEPITVTDQHAVFRAAECYLLSAAEDGLSDPPNLNDRASLVGSAAARRMQALAEALRGFDYRVGGVRRQSCN